MVDKSATKRRRPRKRTEISRKPGRVVRKAPVPTHNFTTDERVIRAMVQTEVQAQVHAQGVGEVARLAKQILEEDHAVLYNLAVVLWDIKSLTVLSNAELHAEGNNSNAIFMFMGGMETALSNLEEALDGIPRFAELVEHTQGQWPVVPDTPEDELPIGTSM